MKFPKYNLKKRKVNAAGKMTAVNMLVCGPVMVCSAYRESIVSSVIRLPAQKPDIILN